MRSKPCACVLIPARNEADRIGATIASLGAQVSVDFCAFQVLVLANNCVDNTAEEARRAGRAHPHLNLIVMEREFSGGDASVGAARGYLMDAAADLLSPDGVIASTDGDTVVRSNWLAATLAAIGHGADLVGGRILVRESTGDRHLRRIYLADTTYRFLMTEVEELIDPTPHDPWPRHFQHFGASLAVTRSAYLRVGGLPRVPHLEDVALHDALRRSDAVIRHCSSVRVTTSARLTGRTQLGLSTQLGEWSQQLEQGRAPIVESAEFIVWRAIRRRHLREVWTREHGGRLGETFGCFCDREMPKLPSPTPPVQPLNDAIASLRARLVHLRRIGPAPLLSPPLEEVESVRLLTPAIQVAKRSA